MKLALSLQMYTLLKHLSGCPYWFSFRDGSKGIERLLAQFTSWHIHKGCPVVCQKSTLLVL